MNAALYAVIALAFGAAGYHAAQSGPPTMTLIQLVAIYVVISGISAALSMGYALRMCELAIRIHLLRRRLQTCAPMTGYVLLENPQPTL